MAGIIEVENLSFKYSGAGEYALKNVSFSVEQGEFLCIIGANGAGKSTLCAALTGLVPLYFTGYMDGSVHIADEDTRHSSVAKLSQKVGFVFQNPFNQLSYTTSTVEEELAYGLCNRGVPRGDMVSKVRKIAKMIRVEKLLHKNPLELSGGQLQRVAIGSALVTDPPVIVLDECTTQLDPLGSEEIFDIALRLNESGVTVIMADHDMQRVARCAKRVLVMKDGELVNINTPQKVFTDTALASYGLEMPDYTRFGEELRKRGKYGGIAILTEREAVEAGKEAKAS